ncbi:MAG: glycoside hydrolase family 15 protein, partial [Dehalococcoidia bacterium]
STDLDAACLLIPLVGFLPPDDPRVLATLDAIQRGLSDGRGLVMRYRSDDGLAGSEGAFLVCTFWLAEAAARSGRLDLASAAFEAAVAHANDLGLLSEEVASDTGELVGNFPQAFSHVGLINAAWALSQAYSSPSSASRCTEWPLPADELRTAMPAPNALTLVG